MSEAPKLDLIGINIITNFDGKTNSSFRFIESAERYLCTISKRAILRTCPKFKISEGYH